MDKPTACVVNLGCRVNRVESDRIASDLAGCGFHLVEEDRAELIVINTCAVTGEAEAKTRKAVRHALGRVCEPQVIVTGCAVNLHAEQLTALSERVVAEPLKTRVAACAQRLFSSALADDDAEAAGSWRAAGPSRSRMGIKIQDGCNNRCSYCIVWKARGPERSEDVEDVLAQVRAAHDAGIAEVVLTGVNLGAYRGLDASGRPVDIAGLLDAILERTDIAHVRLSSIEPMDVSDGLLSRMAASPERVAPFLHLPVQSGCTSTLQRMNRPYTASEFERLADRIRSIGPAASLSGDLIVGFPGEDDKEFESTRSFVERVGFSRLHVFRYSARPGTPAATMPDQVEPEVMAQRSSCIRALVERTAREDAAARIGTVERAVIEYPGRATLGSFHRIVIDDAPDGAVGSLVEVAIMYMDEQGVLHGRMGAHDA